MAAGAKIFHDFQKFLSILIIINEKVRNAKN